MRRTKIFLSIFVVAVLLVTGWGLAPAWSAEEVDTLLEKIYASPLETEGQIERYVEELAKLFQENLRSPVAAVIFHRMETMLPLCGDPGLLDEFYATLSRLGEERKLPNGFLAVRGRILHEKALLRKGRFDEARRLDAYAPYPNTILAIGPFGFDGASLHDTAFSPEAPQLTLKPSAGYAGEVSWQRIERKANRSGFNLRHDLYPDRGCAFALYQFRANTPVAILLSLATQGGCRIWFNNEEIKDLDRRKQFEPMAFKIPLIASSGWNRVLIKLDAGNPAFSFRITDRSGYPIEGLKEMDELRLESVLPAPEGLEGDFDLGSVDRLAFLRSHAALHGDSLQAQLALAETLFSLGLEGEAVAAGEKALLIEEAGAHARYLVANLFRKARYLPQNYRNNRALTLFKQILEIDPDFLPARLALARHDHENDRSEEAIRSLRKILDKNAQYYLANKSLAAIYDRLGWIKERQDMVREMRRIAPRDPYPLLLQAEFYQSINRHDLAFEYYQKAMDMDASRNDILERVAAYLWDQGKEADAFNLYERILDLDKSLLNQERMAGFHRALGDPGRTQEIFEALAKAHPLNPHYRVKLGDLAFERDKPETATQWYQKALDLAPEYFPVRELLEDLQATGDPLFEEFRVDEADYIRDLPGKKEYPKAAAICALDQMVTRVYADGSSRSEIFQIFKILDKNAVERYGRMTVPGRIEILKVIEADGRVLEPIDAEGKSVFNLPGINEGAILILKHNLYQSASTGSPLSLGRFYFQDVEATTPFLLSRYVAAIPRGMDINVERTGADLFEEKQLKRDQETVYVFTARRMDVREKEMNMPPDEKAFPNVALSQQGDWDQVAQVMADQHFSPLRRTGELEQKAAELTEGLESDLDKARAIYAFVNDHVKEDRGYADAAAVLIEGQGSRANLFMALLGAVGVDFDYLRCGLRDGYLQIPPDWSNADQSLLPTDLVRLRPANHPPMLLSFQSRLTPFGEIPPHCFDAPAMKVTGRPERLEILPGGNPAAWVEDTTDLKITINAHDAIIRGSLRFPGHSRIHLKERLQRLDAHDRRRLFEYQIVRGIFPGALIKELEIVGLDEEGGVPSFVFTLEARDFIQPLAGQEGCRLLPVPLDLTGRFLQKKERTFPLLYRGFSSFHLVLDIDFNNEYEVVRLPGSLVQRRHFLNYALLVDETPKGIRVERCLDLIPVDVKPGDHPELVETMRRIDEREMEPIVLTRVISPDSPEPEEQKPEAAAPEEETPEEKAALPKNPEQNEDPEQKGS